MDGRSDIFSVGTVLFEMLTGQPASAGKTFAEIAHAVLHAPPPALVGSPAVANMGRIVHTAMARSREERYASAEHMARELRAALPIEGVETKAKVQTAAADRPALSANAPKSGNRICVPQSARGDSSLAGLEHLTVRSSLAAARYGNERPDLQKIGKEAEVDVILAGGLRALLEGRARKISKRA